MRATKVLSMRRFSLAIIEAHDRAVAAGRVSYKDPSTGYSVFTEETLRYLALVMLSTHIIIFFTESTDGSLIHVHDRKKGICCGNACRHCPYGYFNVPSEIAVELDLDRRVKKSIYLRSKVVFSLFV